MGQTAFSLFVMFVGGGDAQVVDQDVDPWTILQQYFNWQCYL